MAWCADSSFRRCRAMINFWWLFKSQTIWHQNHCSDAMCASLSPNGHPPRLSARAIPRLFRGCWLEYFTILGLCLFRCWTLDGKSQYHSKALSPRWDWKSTQVICSALAKVATSLVLTLHSTCSMNPLVTSVLSFLPQKNGMVSWHGAILWLLEKWRVDSNWLECFARVCALEFSGSSEVKFSKWKVEGMVKQNGREVRRFSGWLLLVWNYLALAYLWRMHYLSRPIGLVTEVKVWKNDDNGSGTMRITVSSAVSYKDEELVLPQTNLCVEPLLHRI